MSRFPGRLRWAITDDGSAELQQGQVVLRQRMLWVMLLGAFLALFCLPVYRYLLVDQVSSVVTRQPPEWAKAAVSLSGPSRPAIQRVLREHPADRDLQLGTMLVGDARTGTDTGNGIEREAVDLGSRRLGFLRSLMAQYPNDPVVLATYLRYCTLKAVRIQRPENEYKPDNKLTFKPITHSVFSQFQAGCERGIELDPDNGYFPTLLAVARFAACEDEGALAALHQASLATRWTDYAEAEMAGGKALLIQAYRDRGPMLHVGPAGGVLLPHLAQIRGVARVAVFQADQCLARGELERGHTIHADVARLGRLMRLNSKILIGRLVGDAVAAIALRIHPEAGRHFGSAEEQKVQRAAARRDYVRRVAREAPAYIAEIERANRELDEFAVKREAFSNGVGFAAWDNLLRRLMWREELGLSLVANLGVSLLLWGGAALLGWLPWRRGVVGPAVAWWLWSRPHPLARVPIFVGFGLALVFGIWGAVTGDEWGRLLLPILLLLLLPTSSLRDARPISTRSLVAVGVGLLGITAASTYPWPMSDLQIGWWKDVVVSTALSGATEGPTEISNMAFAYLLPSGALMGIALPAIVVCFALFRRWSLPSCIERLRLLAKGLAGVLAVGYLAYLLVAVPSNQLDTRSWDHLIEQEAQCIPL